MDKTAYTIWLQTKLKKELEKEAQDKGLTLSAYIRIILEIGRASCRERV